jgi:tetratricopeptide (TPR) repeat protein
MSSIIQLSLASRLSAIGRFEEAEAQYLRLIELDPNFAPAYNSIATFYSDLLGQFAKALKWSRLAREKDPGNIGLLMNEATILLQVGDYEAIEALYEQMQDIDPQHWTVGWTDLVVNLARSNYAGAMEAANWTLPKLGNKPLFQMFAAWTFALEGKYDEARELILQAYPGWEDPGQWDELIQANTFQACVTAGILEISGDPVQARQLMDKIIDDYTRYEDKIMRSYTLAPIDCWVTRGDHDRALAMMETWIQNDFYSYWWINYRWPWWDDLRSEPRFQAVMQTIEEKVAVQRQLVDEMNL